MTQPDAPLPPSEGRRRTDVSLHEFLTVRLDALDRLVAAELAALRREVFAANAASDRAVEVAAVEAKERLHTHNGLIEQMRAQSLLFASRQALEDFKAERHRALDDYKGANDLRFGRVERFQAALIGGFVLVSALGVGTLVKVFAG